MGYVFLYVLSPPCVILCPEPVLQLYGRSDLRQGEVQTLLHGADSQLLQPLGLQERAFRVVAVKERDLPHPHLYGFLHQPLHARGVLRRRHRQMEPCGFLRQVLPGRRSTLRLHNAGLVVGFHHLAFVQVPLPVGDAHLVALPQAQHPHSMPTLLGIQHGIASRHNIFTIEQLHSLVIIREYKKKTA